MARRWPAADSGVELFPAADTGIEAFPGSDNRLELFPAADSGRESFPAADTGIEAFPPIPTFAVLVDASAAGVGTAGALVIAVPWRIASAEGVGAAGVVVGVAVELDAAATGIGAAGAKLVKDEIDATAAGVGAAGASVVPAVPMIAAAAGMGAAGMVGYPIAVVEAFATASGSGSATVIPGVHLSAHAAGAGAAGATAVPVAEITAAAAGIGTAGAEVITFLPSGMVLGSTSSTRWSTSFAQVPGTWSANTTTYPGSAVSGNDLVSQSGGEGLTIEASVYCNNNAFTLDVDVWLQIRVNNGPPVAISAVATQIPRSGNGVVTLQATGVTVPEGGLIRIEGRASSATRIAAQVNAATFVRVLLPS